MFEFAAQYFQPTAPILANLTGFLKCVETARSQLAVSSIKRVARMVTSRYCTTPYPWQTGVPNE
jgi:hypothetical protein